MRITSHKELEVYKLAFEYSMKIFTLSKKSPVRKSSRLQTRFVAHRDPFALTLQRHGGKDDTKSRLSSP
jgi:hypothetical protein